ncbi:TPA: fibrinogen-binding adhesin SdrG C-terminal domain-containing protein [Staphylococcus aureus]|nr:fibrinogen-binding adhesin SdrG C-terminal domain-containing protein [Staphylococcus aureus]MBH4718084.1 fibrinogen-binding adhesin SdrG C-terminal domain-containing protein [Staphylococcus aureus]MBH4719602.1 fibrinogen-binding adhesin SdrG C-terminal domain-containing protein [Staphylococcus aureus]MBH4723585.1 fibrinogen-binding adhesin SdrG C-terminal domain-containing protein [Staphylococcus aureus]MBH4724626.1 fibrinogen-binding adhesin SdrG C-terminal domain-containing protein [Staphy
MMFTKKEKYSIRKFTAGAASIVIGSFMYGATNNNEADASEQVEQGFKMGEETKHQLEQAPKVATEDSKQSNEVYTAQPLKEQKPEVVENKPSPVQAPEEKKVDAKKPLPSIQETNDAKENTSNTVQTKASNIEPTPKEHNVKDIKERSQNVAVKPQPKAQKAVLKDEKKIEGKDVSSKVTVEDSSKIVNPNQSTQGNMISPHNGQRIQLQYRWKFDKDIKPGDYFDFELSKNVNTHGVSVRRKVPNIKNGSLVMATGQVLDNGKIRYTFTDYIKDKVNVTANLNLNLFIDPKEVQNSGDQTISATLNNKTISTKVNVQYLNGAGQNGPNVNGSFEKLDKENNTFTHVAYINPSGNVINSASAYGRIISGMSGTNPKNIRVYEYIGSGNPPQSVYLDRSNTSLWKDVTNDFKDKLTIQNDGYQLNFDKLDKRYAVSYEGEYKKGNADLKFQTQVSGYTSEFYPEYYSTAVWNNGLVFFQNDANGNGQNGPIIDSNNFDFQEDTGNGEIHGHNNGNQTFEEDTDNDKPIHQNGGHTPIDWEEKLPDEHGHNNGEIIEEDTKPIDWEEKLPDEHGHNNGEIIEEDTKPIDWEEKLPDEHGHNNGDQTEDEDTMPPRPIPPIPEPQPEPRPVPPTPEPQPEPKPVPPTPKPQPMKSEGSSVSKSIDKTKMYKQINELPNAGEETNKTTLIAGIFAVLGSLVLFRRNRQSK